MNLSALLSFKFKESAQNAEKSMFCSVLPFIIAKYLVHLSNRKTIQISYDYARQNNSLRDLLCV